ncbi:polysaccharide biosynthesis protein [Halobellus salinus]|uniref:Polysaccharide biosynthesis protein n=1 Tax=Halobellus salinus TaxID=931585 RepID=A0A830ELY6_9EURY|nr:flippase [Halobellus salinus]GGJ01927.1 polysaccharide biosynthesis protein [Halobellus salinus]SMP18070.1 Membrane protein involved in the export of O-antigen and teichoic acid [Halobellus salinus]
MGSLRLGQTSVVYFVSKLLASALGFIATIYVARLLGSGALGIYSVATAVVSWLVLFGTMGVTSGMTKRVSERDESSAYAIAGVSIVSVFAVGLATAILLFRGEVNDYIGFSAAVFIAAMVVVTLAQSTVMSLLNGRKLVHIAGVFSPVKTGSRAGSQIVALSLGLGIVGLFGGYIIGYVVVVLGGFYVLIRSFDEITMPRARHFRGILSFAKYAWLGGLRSKAFNWVDIALLGFFVSNAFIGYYTAAWNIAQFLVVFGTAISRTLFPEMSESAVADDSEAVSDLLNTALSFAGLIMIPGLVGGTLIGEQLLRIYGPDFTQAGLVLSVLIFATLLQSYQKQFTTTLNALDRPDIAFKINLVFILSNVVLNVVLIVVYGWVGAAVATALSIVISLVVAYKYIGSILDFTIPVEEISKQWIAAGLMACFLIALIRVETRHITINSNILFVLLAVLSGAGIYLGSLLGLSKRLRKTVRDNLPERLYPA